MLTMIIDENRIEEVTRKFLGDLINTTTLENFLPNLKKQIGGHDINARGYYLGFYLALGESFGVNEQTTIATLEMYFDVYLNELVDDEGFRSEVQTVQRELEGNERELKTSTLS